MSTFRDFIINTEFSTLETIGNDASATVTLPGGTVVASGATWTASADIPIQGSGSFRSLISSSKIPGENYPVSTLTIDRTWSGSNMTLTIFVYRLNSSTIRVEASAYNPYGVSKTSPAGNEVFTVLVSNMSIPF